MTEPGPPWFAGSDQSHHSPYRHPHSPDARFASHELGIKSYASQMMHFRLLCQ